MTNPADSTPPPPSAPSLPEGVLAARLGPGANCSSAGSAIDVLFYGSVIVGALAVALAAAFPPAELEPAPAPAPATNPAPEGEEGERQKGAGEGREG